MYHEIKCIFKKIISSDNVYKSWMLLFSLFDKQKPVTNEIKPIEYVKIMQI